MPHKVFNKVRLNPIQTTQCLLVLAIVLTGCVSTPPAPPERSKVEDPAPTPDPRISQLMATAQRNFELDLLTTPVNNNAYLNYLQVLAIQPEHPGANQGISDIVEKYLEWAISNAQHHNLRKATRYLNKARSVDETHPGIAPVALLIEQQRTARQRVYRLEAADVSNRSSRLKQQLTDIAAEIERLGASVQINAPKDEQARWLYQELNGHTSERLSAIFEYSPSPRLILQY